MAEKIYYGFIALFFGGLIYAALMFGFTDTSGSERVLKANGFTNITVGGYAWFSCGKGDWFQTKFEATSVNGTHVSGAVCRGLIFKNSTIRFD